MAGFLDASWLFDENIYPLIKPINKQNKNNNKIEYNLVHDNEGQIINFMCGDENMIQHMNYFKKINVNNKNYFISKTNNNIEYKESIEEYIPEHPLFLSITLKYEDIEYDIYDNIKPYLVYGNELPITFFIAFMKKYYNIIIDYSCEKIPITIHYIGSNFNINALENNETIIIDENITIKNREILEQ